MNNNKKRNNNKIIMSKITIKKEINDHYDYDTN